MCVCEHYIRLTQKSKLEGEMKFEIRNRGEIVLIHSWKKKRVSEKGISVLQASECRWWEITRTTSAGLYFT